MSEEISSAVHDNTRQSLLNDPSDVQSKVGAVAYFVEGQKQNDLEDDFVVSTKTKENQQFIGLTKEELEGYINDPKWKRIRWIIAILYILIIIGLLIGSILLIIYSSRCPPQPKLVWYEKEVIYEIDVRTFYDSNGDAIGDIQGVQDKFDYFEKNAIKSILLRSSIFNGTTGTSIQLDGQPLPGRKVDLLTIDPIIASENQLVDLIKIFNRKDMHLVLDLPISTTSDPNGYTWYGSNQTLKKKVTNPCLENPSNLGCQYYQAYGLLPLNFNSPMIAEAAESRISYWLEKKRIDGIRVNLPLVYNSSAGSHRISYKTIQNWINLINKIEKKTKPKLLLIDVPFAFQTQVLNTKYNNTIAQPLFVINNQKITGQILDERFQSFQSKPKYWQLGSKRTSDASGIIESENLSKEMVLTTIMLIGGTPVVLYGEEIGQDQRKNPLMSWTPDLSSGGFSACSSAECQRIFSAFPIDSAKINVKREEALGGGGDSKDSLLKLFRTLSKLRSKESFQFGLFKSGFNHQSNIFWFIREASGHAGYIILFNLNSEVNHISLNDLTDGNVPAHIHYEYQWPRSSLSSYAQAHFHSDNLLIDPQSINIFSWKAKLLKPNILSQKIKEH